ncbi:MAG: RluA family pseudouridine synthase [bacterium]|nr:RluA family pseudouridine synthase [bacterium]
MESLKSIFKDGMLLVVEKPAGITIEEAAELLSAHSELERSGIAHRLDKDTSGVLLVALTPEMLSYLQEQFQERLVRKTYLALVSGNITEEQGRIEAPLGRSPGDRRKQKAYGSTEPHKGTVREAVTEYRVKERLPGYTLLEVFPKTGRKHQIRAHLASIGHPIAGDKLYGFKDQVNPPGLTRQFLHASQLQLTMPDGEEKTFTSQLPEDLHNILNALKTHENDN